MCKLVLMVCSSLLCLLTAPSWAHAESMWHLMNSVVIKTNGNSSLLLVPSESIVTARYFPQKNQYSIDILTKRCPARPEIGYPEDVEIIRHTPAVSTKHICYDGYPDPTTGVFIPQWHPWTIPGQKANPQGIAERRKWLRDIITNAQSRVLKSAGCRKRTKQGTFRTAYKNCPRMPLAKDLGLSADGAEVKWGGCRHRPETDYRRLVLTDPYAVPGEQPKPRSSEITTCSGAIIPQQLYPAFRPPAPLPPVATPTT